MFSIQDQDIIPDVFKHNVLHQYAGGYASFEGWIRKENAGKIVTRLTYDVHVSLAEKEGKKIVEEAVHTFKVLSACAVHRKGTLQVGDIAVWVGVASVHRGEAFLACQYIIDTIKHRLPIWKKEFYENGESEWMHQCECVHKV